MRYCGPRAPPLSLGLMTNRGIFVRRTLRQGPSAVHQNLRVEFPCSTTVTLFILSTAEIPFVSVSTPDGLVAIRE